MNSVLCPFRVKCLGRFGIRENDPPSCWCERFDKVLGCCGYVKRARRLGQKPLPRPWVGAQGPVLGRGPERRPDRGDRQKPAQSAQVAVDPPGVQLTMFRSE